jgi:arylformamidase
MRRSSRSVAVCSIMAIVVVLAAGCASETSGEQADATATASTDVAAPPASTPSVPPPSVPPPSVLAPSAPTSAVEAECREASTGSTTFAYADRPGVNPNLTSVDVYLPAGCGRVPVIMWVHGGGWRQGDKASGPVARKAAWAESLGAALVSVNYRLTTPGSDVMWPDHGDDVSAAVAWVQSEGPAVGLDPDHLAMVGHSAGSHLVSIVGTDPALVKRAGGDPFGIDCVVALDGASDLTGRAGDDLIANAFGTDPDVLGSASPLIQVERNGAPSAPFFVVSRGGARRIAGAQQFVDAINEAGGSADLLDATPYSHEDVNSQLGATGETLVTPPVTDFVRSCLVR